MKIGILTDIHLKSPKSIEKEYGNFSRRFDSEETSVENDLKKSKEVKRLLDRANAFREFIIDIDCDILILSGDISSSDSIDDLDYVFSIIKSRREDLKVLMVKGNHDYWENYRPYISLDELIEEHSKIFKKYGVVYLQDNHFIKENILFVGYDGWYNVDPRSQTKDNTMIPRFNSLGADSFLFMKKREMVGLDRVLKELSKDENKGKYKICVTHFNFKSDPNYENLKANPNFLSILKENCNIVIFGHNHLVEDRIEDGVRLINAGVSKEYNKFNLKIIEIK